MRSAIAIATLASVAAASLQPVADPGHVDEPVHEDHHGADIHHPNNLDSIDNIGEPPILPPILPEECYDDKDEHKDCDHHHVSPERPIVYETVVHTVLSCEEEKLECTTTDFVPVQPPTSIDGDEITTVTAYTLSVETIIGCPVTVIECPDDKKTDTITTTVTLPAFTTVCPVSEATKYMLVQPHPTPEPVHPVGEPIEEPIGEPIGEPVGEPIGEPIEEPIEEPIGVPQPIEEPIGSEPFYPTATPSDVPFPIGTGSSSYYLPSGTGAIYPSATQFEGAAVAVRSSIVLVGLGAFAAFFL